MKQATKTALLVLGSVLVAFAMIVGGGVWWVKANWGGLKGDIKNRIEEVRVDASAFAAAHEKKDCMPEARSRARACTLSPTCMVDGTIFLEFCLRSAAESPGLCDDVPEATDEPGEWPEQRCRELDRERELSCPMLFVIFQAHCLGQEQRGD